MSRTRPAAGPAASPGEVIRAPLHALWDRYRPAPRTPVPPDVPLATVVSPLPAAPPPPPSPVPDQAATHAALHACLQTFLVEARDPILRGERLALLRTLLGPDADRLVDRADGTASAKAASPGTPP